MRKLWSLLFSYRLRALIKKEFAQTRHDRKLMFTLTSCPSCSYSRRVRAELRR